jgi:hypothetical protein
MFVTSRPEVHNHEVALPALLSVRMCRTRRIITYGKPGHCTPKGVRGFWSIRWL